MLIFRAFFSFLVKERWALFIPVFLFFPSCVCFPVTLLYSNAFLCIAIVSVIFFCVCPSAVTNRTSSLSFPFSGGGAFVLVDRQKLASALAEALRLESKAEGVAAKLESGQESLDSSSDGANDEDQQPA